MGAIGDLAVRGAARAEGRARLRLLAVLGLGAALLAGCESIYTGGGGGPVMYPGGVGAAPVWGVEEGSLYAAGFTMEDRRRIADAAGQILRPGGPVSAQWGPTGSGKTGSILAGEPFLVGLDVLAGGRIAAPGGIDTSVPLDAASGTYRSADNVNVRSAPSTEGTVLRTMPAGTLVRAYGQAQPEDWLLIGPADEVWGYAYGPLLEPTGEGDPILAGGTPRQPKLCRDLSLTLTMPGGQADRWSQVVCTQKGGVWSVTSMRGVS